MADRIVTAPILHLVRPFIEVDRGRGASEVCRGRFASNLALAVMARQAQRSVSHFSRAFKETFGCTPHAHLLRLRIEFAQKLMLSTRDPLTHIAFECGFADLSHLCKAFRREIGEPPSTWRRRNLSDPQAGPNGN
jgi:transcriptional regulator GlxA family with amidase domain